jgi:ferredoxin-NADP reductase
VSLEAVERRTTDDRPLAGDLPARIPLVVESITREAEGVISIGLSAADGGALPAWTPGAHVDLLLDARIERQYSLCGDTNEPRRWRVAVLREPASRGGSAWLHERLQVGDRLLASPPRNHFALEPADAYVLVAGGIGITPLLPMVRELARQGAKWRLLYGGRKRASMAFICELERYGERVRVEPEDEHGLLDLERWIGPPGTAVGVYCCGPEALLAAVESQCRDWPEGALHVERFRPRPAIQPGDDGSFELILGRSGRSCVVAPHETILDALDRLGVHVPRSCGEGTCGTCLTAVLEGTPDHRDSFLMGKKRAANDAICVCCSRSRMPRLVLDL